MTATRALTLTGMVFPRNECFSVPFSNSSRWFSSKPDATSKDDKDKKDEITQEEINAWFDHPDVDEPVEFYNWEDPFISIVKTRAEADGLRTLNLHERLKRKTSLNHRMRAKQKMIPGVIYGTDGKHYSPLLLHITIARIAMTIELTCLSSLHCFAIGHILLIFPLHLALSHYKREQYGL